MCVPKRRNTRAPSETADSSSHVGATSSSANKRFNDAGALGIESTPWASARSTIARPPAWPRQVLPIAKLGRNAARRHVVRIPGYGATLRRMTGLADLHRHLDGSLRRSTLRALADEQGVTVRDDVRFTRGMGLDAALACFAV